MRYLTLLVLLLLLAASAATAQPVGQSANGAEFHEIDAGDRWRVFSSKAPGVAPLNTPGASRLKASLDDPESNTFVAFPALAVDDLEDRELLSSTEAQEIRDDLEAEGRDYRRVADFFVVHLEAAEEAARKAAQSPRGSFRADEKSLFGWQDPKTFSDSWSKSESGDLEIFSIDQGIFSGDVTVSLPLTAEINGTVIYQVKKKFGIPYKFRLLEANVDGEVAVQGSIVASAELSYTEEWSWKHHVLTVRLADFVIWVGIIPIYFEFNLPIDVGIDASVKLAGHAELRADLIGTASFNVVCTSSDCEGTTDFEDSFNIADPMYDLTLDANARIWARAAVEMEIYDENVALVWVGATGFVQAHLFGYLGNQCGDADGNGSAESLEDLLLDLDAGYTVDAGLSGYLLPDKEWILLEDLWHLYFWDLWEDSGGWNLADPIITGPRSLDAGQLAMYEFRSRPCYPYTDDLNLVWTGPVTGSGSLMPRAGVLTDAEVPADGVYTLEVTVVDDAHGRDFGVSTSMEVMVIDPYGGTQTLVNGVAEIDLTGAADNKSFFAVDVPEGATDLSIDLSDGTGNADLYVRRGSRPSTLTFDCGSTSSGNTERCTFPAPEAGRYHVMVHGSGAYSGASLVATYTEPTSTELVAGSPTIDLAGATGTKTYFTVEVPAGATDLVFTLSGGSGDADLYVRYATWPGLTAFDCRSWEGGNEDSCLFPSPQGGTYYAMVYAADAYSQVSLEATYRSPGGELVNGVPVTDLSGADGSRTFYTIDVPPGANDLAFELSEGTGDADIYVRFGTQPSTLTYDCHSWNIGNSDRCAFPSPEPGQYIVLVYGHTGYSGASLVATYTDAAELTNGAPESGLAGTKYDETFFTLLVPEGAANLTFTLASVTGDADLYVRFEAQPDRDAFLQDCKSEEPEGQVDSCPIPSPQAGRYHVLVYAFSDYTEATLTAAYTEPATDGSLANGVRQSDLIGDQDSEVFLTIDVPAGATDLTVNLLGGSGDADLYVRFGLQPSISSYDCRSWVDGNSESCSFPQPQVGTYHVLVHGYSGYSGVSLTATYTQLDNPGGELANGTPESNLAGDPDDETYYTLEVPAGAAGLTFTLSSGAGDADLYVRFGEPPSTSVYDCRDWEIGNGDDCSFVIPQAGTYHVLVHAYSSYSGVDLVASYTAPGADKVFCDGFESGDLTAWSDP